jgi:hypothetical protein
MRKFLAVFIATCFWATILAASLVTNGCTPATTQEIVTDSQIVAEATLQIAQDPAFVAMYPTPAADMVLAANSLLKLANAWKPGNSTAEIGAIVSTIQSILQVIPATANNPWVSLLPVLGAAIAILVAAIQNNQSSLTKAYKSGVIKHRLGRSMAGDFNAAWVNAGGKPLK